MNLAQGYPIPLGVTLHENGVNFSVFVHGFSPIHLILRDPVSKEVISEFEIAHRTGQVAHIFVDGLTPPFLYTYKINGYEVLDPLARHVGSPQKWGDKSPYHPIGSLPVEAPFDWEEASRPVITREDLIIYEMHVRGMTIDPSSQVTHPGTFKGLIEKIPHLKDLGVNAVELLPIHEFNENEYVPMNPAYLGKLKQFWGYSTVNFFSPMNRYSSNGTGAKGEFKELVKALHQEEIMVFLDVVFNHTAEGNELGPIQSYKALGGHPYYLFDPNGDYSNYTGTGNTFNCNHPVVISLIIDALRYWVTEMHVDGFRFDLASVFYRGGKGNVLQFPPIVDAIAKDPILANTKLIVEPWDAAGLYQVGAFSPDSVRWGEWNGRFRDCIRRFIKGDSHLKGEFATRLSGSQDLYGHDKKRPRNSINYITSHDGFSLCDLVSYNQKHNEANGENNQDGMNDNNSWNCGIEGKTEDPKILALRERQMRNLHLALMVSQGVPMVYMGDEYGHTKEGNNNTWCQDNHLSWFLWDRLKERSGFYRFYKGLIHFRRANPVFRHRIFLRDDMIQWHGKLPDDPLWGEDDHFVAFTLFDRERGYDIYVAFNASEHDAEVTFPKRTGSKVWRWVANTALPSPQDFYEPSSRLFVKEPSYKMVGYSSLILQAEQEYE